MKGKGERRGSFNKKAATGSLNIIQRNVKRLDQSRINKKKRKKKRKDSWAPYKLQP